jgi:hypothetical protein
MNMIFFAFPEEMQKGLSLFEGENGNKEGNRIINCFIFTGISRVALSLFLPEGMKTIILKIPGLDLTGELSVHYCAF